jgi:hypothetical protein
LIAAELEARAALYRGDGYTDDVSLAIRRTWLAAARIARSRGIEAVTS